METGDKAKISGNKKGKKQIREANLKENEIRFCLPTLQRNYYSYHVSKMMWRN